MNRAERRRMEREVGRHRAPSKHGRRRAFRAVDPPQPEHFDALARAGFVVARPDLEVTDGPR